MQRFMGMMPSSEVEICKFYKDDAGLKVGIEAGKNGWTVMYADHSSDYKDCVDTAQNNFDKAYKCAEMHVGYLTEIKTSSDECCGEC